MQIIETRKTASITDMREPKKLLEFANGEPVAIMNHNNLMCYIVPAKKVSNQESRYIDNNELKEFLEKELPIIQPALDYLRDK